MASRLDIVVGRIERLALDAIVNPANQALVPGAGADGAIRAAAGPELDIFLATHGPLPASGALLSPGFRLPARHVIHTAAPVWFLDGEDTEKIRGLSNCYTACLDVAAEAKLTSIAFPCIGTGIFGWPKEIASEIAVTAVRAHPHPPARVVFCCFIEDDAWFYRAHLKR